MYIYISDITFREIGIRVAQNSYWAEILKMGIIATHNPGIGEFQLVSWLLRVQVVIG